MPARQCHHCKQWIKQGEPHDCWTTTEAALTAELDEDLREAWERLRESAAELGEQRIYASHKSIMFSRQSCYFFVRPKRSFLELNVFLGRTVQAPQIKRVIEASAAKKVHVIHVRHRDEVEAPITSWLQEAYEFNGAPRPPAARAARKPKPKPKPSRAASAPGTAARARGTRRRARARTPRR